MTSLHVGDTAADIGAILGAILALLTLVALLWTWTGGLRRWRARRARQRSTEEFLVRFQRSWEGSPSAPGFPPRAGWPETILARLEEMGRSVSDAEVAAGRAMRRALHCAHQLTWLMGRVRDLERRAGIAEEQCPPYVEDERG